MRTYPVGAAGIGVGAAGIAARSLRIAGGKQLYTKHDALLELHLRRDTFNGKDSQQIGRPKKSLLVVMFWYCLLTFGAVKLVQWCTFSWGELALLIVLMALVMLSVQILIHSTRSEYSTPPMVNQAETLKVSLLPK